MDVDDGVLITSALQLARGVYPERLRSFIRAFHEDDPEELIDELFAEAQEMSKTEYFKEWAKTFPPIEESAKYPLK